MIRTWTALVALVGGCADPGRAGSLPVAEPARADPAGVFLQPALFACPSPSCGWRVGEVNQATIDCPDGAVDQATCKVDAFDFDRLGLRDEVDAALQDERLLLRGRLRSDPDPARYGGYVTTLIATEAWIGGTGAEPVGIFAREVDNGVVCVTDPCETLDEKVVNRPRRRALAELDFGPSGATPEQIDEALAATGTEDGLIVAGERFEVVGTAGTAAGRRVTEYYVRASP